MNHRERVALEILNCVLKRHWASREEALKMAKFYGRGRFRPDKCRWCKQWRIVKWSFVK